MKKNILMILLALLLILPIKVNAVDATIEEQRAAILQIAKTYHRQGTQLQYDSYRKNYYASPEDATSQNTIYTVCSGFTFSVYYQTLGIKIPETTQSLIKFASEHKEKGNNKNIIFYYERDSETQEFYDGDKSLSEEEINAEYLEKAQPGDIIVVQYSGGNSGHAMLVTANDGNKVTYYHSGGEKYDLKNLKEIFEPTISNVSSESVYYLDGSSKVALIRVITDDSTYIDDKGKISKYNGITSSAKTRLDYPNIDITKTITIENLDGEQFSNLSANINDKIIYTITVKNSSGSTYNNPIDVIETINPNLVFVDDGDGTFDEGKNQLKWTINSLESNAKATFTYIMQIPNDESLLGTVLYSKGKVGDIYNSRLAIKVDKKLDLEQKNKLEEAFNLLKTNSTIGKDFIDLVYLQALDLEVKLSKYNFDDIIGVADFDETPVKHAMVKNTRMKYMINHNAYGLRITGGVTDNGNWNYYTEYHINDRIRSLNLNPYENSNILETGDILLIHTDKGESEYSDKAYIYIEDTLYRKTGENQFEALSGTALRDFLNNTIADNFVILRPAKIIGLDNIDEEDNNQNINGDEEDIKNPETSVSFNYWIVVFAANVIVIGILTRKAKKL